MSGPKEPRERLRAANPVPPEDVPPPDSPHAVALFERIVASGQETTPLRTRLRRRRLWLLLPATLLAGAAGYGIFHTVSQPLVVACYSQPSLSASRALVSAGDDPVAACGVLWRAGGEFNPEGHSQIPPLAACVLGTGAIGVFPDTLGSGTCSTLGLTPASDPETGGEENLVILQVQEALADQFLSRCVGREEAVAIVEQELRSHGLQSWRVAAETPFTKQEPCASVAFDVPHQTISLVPVSNST